MSVGGSNGGEKGGSVEGASVEEVGRFCKRDNISSYKYRCEENWRELKTCGR